MLRRIVWRIYKVLWIPEIINLLGLSEIYHCYIILALGEKELSGLSLTKEIKKVSAGDCNPRIERLYVELDKLKKEGLVSSREGAIKHEEKRGRTRVYYKLTREGEDLLEVYKEKFFDVK